MAQTTSAQESRTPLTDSLLHTNMLRVFLGGICGLAAGLVFLGITTLFTPAGAGKLWWIQLLASAIYPSQAMAYEVTSHVLIAGFVLHFGLSALNGLVMGKMTTTHSVGKLSAYGLVLGGLCWLASNMFMPDFFTIQILDLIGQWERIAFFVPFAVSLGILLGLSSKALNA